MGKRSSFPRRPRDTYDTPADALPPLMQHISATRQFIEPCAGAAALQTAANFAYLADIQPRAKGISKADGADIPQEFDGFPIITNPPFKRSVFRRLLSTWLFDQGREVWLLIPAGFLFNLWFSKAGFLPHVAEIQPLHRLKWIPGSPYSETTDHCWCRFVPGSPGRVLFHPRVIEGAGVRLWRPDVGFCGPFGDKTEDKLSFAEPRRLIHEVAT